MQRRPRLWSCRSLKGGDPLSLASRDCGPDPILRRRCLFRECRPSRRSRSSYGSRWKPFTSLEANRGNSFKASTSRAGLRSVLKTGPQNRSNAPHRTLYTRDLMQYTARKHENSKRRRSRNTTGSTRGARGGRTNRCGQIPRGVEARFFMTFLLLLLPRIFFLRTGGGGW